jgi:uncharacterized protein (TIGR02217 family)
VASRLTQQGLEVLSTPGPGARLTQHGVEVLTYSGPAARWTQAALEVTTTTLAPPRLTQHGLEVLWLSVPPPVLPRFPAALAYGAQGGPGFSTDVVLTADGQESRNINWAEARCRWDVGSIHRTKAEIEVLIAFFHAATQGQEGLFLFRDFTDDTFDNAIAVGDGATSTFPLVKVYATGPYTSTRRLTRPIEGTVGVRLNGALVSGWTLDSSTGLLTMAAAPAAGVVVSASGTFEVLCRFAQDVLPVTRVAPDAYSCGNMEIVEVRD